MALQDYAKMLDQFDPMEIERKIAQTRGLQNDNLKFQRDSAEADRKLTQENLLRRATRDALDPTTGTLDPAKYRRSLGELGDYSGLQALEKDEAAKVKARFDNNKAQRDADKAQLEEKLKKFEIAGQIMGSVKDQSTWELARQQTAEFFGPEAAQQLPEQYDPALIEQKRRQAMPIKEQLEQEWKKKGYDLDVEKFGETKRDNKARLAETVRGHNMADARGKEDSRLKAHEIANGGKAPPGYRWTEGGDLQAITGGPGDKLPESQQKQVVGVNNLNNAIKEYRSELERYGPADSLRPDARATMGTKYNNMMLQAKEAYNLGVLNGPDLQILQSVITDPRSLTGAITSKKALDTQASELARIMQGVAAVSNRARQPKDTAVSVPPAAAEMLRKQPNLRAQFDAKYGEGAAASVLGK